MVHVFQGELRQADTMLKDAIRMAGEHTPTPAGRLNLAYVYYHRNELDAAGAELESVLQAKDKVYVGHLGRAHLDLLKVRVAQGDIAAAEKELEEAGKILLEQEPAEVNLGSVAAYSLAIAAVAGNEEEIERRLDEFAGYEHFRRYNPPPAAMYLLYKRRGEAAMETLEAEYQQCRREGFRYICCITRLEQVAATADYEQALSFLKEALVLARPEGIIRLFVDFGIELAPLLRKAIKQGIEPEFARTLLHIIEEEDRQKQARKKGIAEAVPADILSERELGVLRLVADGASNMQIADKLSISLATVKTHVHHIIDKLEVRDRSQAVYRARELKLL
jgi:LuxR family transcriptional regulator, maltose regulon positive regulatory protein